MNHLELATKNDTLIQTLQLQSQETSFTKFTEQMGEWS